MIKHILKNKLFKFKNGETTLRCKGTQATKRPGIPSQVNYGALTSSLLSGDLPRGCVRACMHTR
jgi:hypothetical protein